ncbi:MAG: hypothetical protein MK086_04850 [Flavobacteriales bacterium]|nr:hypothetical protein [Flavobacteriales bacterium]
MIQYRFNCKNQLPYHIEVEVTLTAHHRFIKAIIPYWRPGRYEPGNFTRNFIGLEATTHGIPLYCRKTSANVFEIIATEGEEVVISYQLYGRELTAGNTYFDGELLLINPVNACVYFEGQEEEACSIDVHLEQGWAISTALKKSGDSVYQARDMQHMMDTPIMAAANIDVLKYAVSGVEYFIHIIGEFLGEEQNLLRDFEMFTRKQVEAFGTIPVDEYHFLLILLPHRAYHGVEHENSTVIILGPLEQLDERTRYKELLGVSSHELYHTWNIKYIRPTDWLPYDFTKADFSRLGYLAEGITTYMGDLMLWQSGVFSDEDYFEELATLLKRHRDNEGRFALSLADSSMDTWVDGYGRGTPRRRVSIYVEGALLAFVCDVWIIDATKGSLNLSSAMKILFGRVSRNRGYTEDQYWDILAEVAEKPWHKLRKKVVDGRGYLEEYVLEAFSMLDLKLEQNDSTHFLEKKFGFRLLKNGNQQLVSNVFRGSPAELGGLWFDDEITSINGMEVDEFLKRVDSSLSSLTIEFISGFRKRSAILESNGRAYGNRLCIRSGESILYEFWKN